MQITRFNKDEKFRVIISGISFYATASEIRNGVGDTAKPNAAIQKCLDALEFIRSGQGIADQCTTGLAGTWEGFNVQLDKHVR
jgi:GTP cyclohydrolase III